MSLRNSFKLEKAMDLEKVFDAAVREMEQMEDLLRKKFEDKRKRKKIKKLAKIIQKKEKQKR